MSKLNTRSFKDRLSEFVPHEYIDSKLIDAVFDKSIKFFTSQYCIDYNHEDFEGKLKRAFEEIISSRLNEACILEIVDFAPKVYYKALISTQYYIQKFVPWVLINCEIPYCCIDIYIWMIFCAELHYDLLEDFIDKHNTSSPISIIYVSKLFNILINYSNKLDIRSSEKIKNYILDYHARYVFSEIKEKTRSEDETQKLWNNPDLISGKAAPARLLFTIPLILTNREYLIPRYEEIMDCWTLYLQILDDILDVEEDINNHNYGLGLSIYFWLMRSGYTSRDAIESLKYGTGLAMGLERCKNELNRVLKISFEIKDMLMVYSAYFGLFQISKFKQTQLEVYSNYFKVKTIS